MAKKKKNGTWLLVVGIWQDQNMAQRRIPLRFVLWAVCDPLPAWDWDWDWVTHA
jgi:hypothetical protein